MHGRILDNGSTICIADIEYIIISSLHSGGQGTVYKIKRKSDNYICALKILEEKDNAILTNKVSNINYIISQRRDRLDNINKNLNANNLDYVLPDKFYENTAVDPHQYGYIMRYVSGENIFKNDQTKRMTINEKLVLIKRIAKAIDALHTNGWVYGDISDGNILWDKENNIIHIIDCDNMSHTSKINDGSCDFVRGTGFFEAPEVAFKDSKVNYNTDRYALATLAFLIVTDKCLLSPYHGKAMGDPPYPQSMEEIAEFVKDGAMDNKWEIFVFDRTSHSNDISDLFVLPRNDAERVKREMFKYAIEQWKLLPENVKELFYQAFSDPFKADARPTASMWKNIRIPSEPSTHTYPAQQPTRRESASTSHPTVILQFKRSFRHGTYRNTVTVGEDRAPYIITGEDFGLRVPYLRKDICIFRHTTIGKVYTIADEWAFQSFIKTDISISIAGYQSPLGYQKAIYLKDMYEIELNSDLSIYIELQ